MNVDEGIALTVERLPHRRPSGAAPSQTTPTLRYDGLDEVKQGRTTYKEGERFVVQLGVCMTTRGWPRPINGDGLPTVYISANDETPWEIETAEAHDRIDECVTGRVCQVCGEPITEPGFAVPRFGDERQHPNGEALLHGRCLVLSLDHCPRLRDWASAGMLTILREPDGTKYDLEDRLDWPGRPQIHLKSVDWKVIAKRWDTTGSPNPCLETGEDPETYYRRRVCGLPFTGETATDRWQRLHDEDVARQRRWEQLPAWRRALVSAPGRVPPVVPHLALPDDVRPG